VIDVKSTQLNRSSASSVPAEAFFSPTVASARYLGVARVAASGLHANGTSRRGLGGGELRLFRLGVMTLQQNPEEATSSRPAL
jgi:hypothetical protein